MTSPNVRIELSPRDDIERTLRKFRKACDNAGILKRCRETERYEKPGERERNDRRRKLRKMIRDERKDQERHAKEISKLRKDLFNS